MDYKLHFSQARWDAYKRENDEAEENTLARYLWNIQLCEALYPVLHLAEVSLRNHIDASLSNVYGEAWFSEASAQLHSHEKDEILRVQLKLETDKASRGHLIASLSFGFWTGLFARPYHSSLWPRCIKATFPYLQRRNRTAGFIHPKLNSIRRLRNRVFHHEPIWKERALTQKHEEMLALLAWFSPDLLDVSKRIDRFEEVFKNKPD